MSGRKRRPLKENDAWWQYRKITKTTTKKKFKRTIQFKFRKLFQAAASGEDGLAGRGIDSSQRDLISLQFNSVPLNFITNQI